MSDIAADDNANAPQTAMLAWRGGGQRWITIVVKLSYRLGGKLAERVRAAPLEPHELAPCKPYAEVVARGEVADGANRLVGVAVARGPAILMQKRVVARSSFLVDADDPRVTARLGPAAITLPPVDENGDLVVDERDLTCFQSAPADQWLDEIRGGERLRIIGFQALTALELKLPELVASASLVGPAGVIAVPVLGDTLTIDADAGLASLVFRGAVERPRMIESMTVRAGLTAGRSAHDGTLRPAAWRPRPKRPRSPAVDPLEIENRSPFVVWPMRWLSAPGERRRVIIVKASFDVAADGRSIALSPEQAPLQADSYNPDVPAELELASDFAPVKPRADVLLRADAAPPPGASIGAVELEVAGVKLRLAVLGERTWGAQGVPGPPAVCAPLRLRWCHAFGGAGVPENPVGTGATTATPPPRIELADRMLRYAGDAPAPAPTGPVAPEWPARRGRLGTFDDAWVSDRWPSMPRDFDPAFHQAAPPSCQTTVIAADAPIVVRGVRADGRAVELRLPGLRPRTFVSLAGIAPFELETRLDTVTIDLVASRVLVVWRGSYACHDSADERALVLADSTASALSADDVVALRAVWHEREFRERHRFEPGEQRPPTLASLALRWKHWRRSLSQRPEGLAAASTPLSKADLALMRSEGRSLRGVNLSHAELQGADLREADLRGAILRGAKLAGADLEGANLEGAILAGADAEAASFRRARLVLADLTGARASTCDFSAATLDHATFARAQLKKSRWVAAKGSRVSLVGAKADGAMLSKARLPKLNLTDAVVDDADFSDADLAGSSLQETSALRANFDRATLTHARFELAACSGATFRNAKAAGATWDGADLSDADFSGAALPSCVFGGSLLGRAKLAAVEARGALFREVDARHADFTRADLRESSFEGALLDGAQLGGANMHAANLIEASLVGARLDGTVLTGTRPPRRV